MTRGASGAGNAVTRAEDHDRLIATVDRYIAAAFNGSFTPEDREEIRQDAFVGLEKKRAREPIRDPEAVLIACARNAARMRLRCHDRHRRRSFDPHDSAETRIPDRGADPEELVLRADEDRRVRLLVEQLDGGERAVLKLRLEHELATKEIAAHLSVSVSRANKLLKRGGRAVVAGLGASELEAFSRRQRSLLAAVVMGIASERQRRAGEQLLDDPHARALLAELRGLGQKTAAALPPVPAIAAEHSTGRLLELAAHVKDQLADAAGVAKQHPTAAYVRASDPTPLVGARPGTVAATLASCLAVAGGGAYCAVEGLPSQLGAPLGLQRETADAKPEAKAPEPAKPPAAPITPPVAQTPAPAKPPASAAPPAAPAPAPAPAPAGSPAQQQFGIERAQQPAAPAAPAPPSGGGGGGGGTDQFGIE